MPADLPYRLYLEFSLTIQLKLTVVHYTLFLYINARGALEFHGKLCCGHLAVRESAQLLKCECYALALPKIKVNYKWVFGQRFNVIKR